MWKERVEVGYGLYMGGDLVGGSDLEVTNQGLLSPQPHASFQPHLMHLRRPSSPSIRADIGHLSPDSIALCRPNQRCYAVDCCIGQEISRYQVVWYPRW